MAKAFCFCSCSHARTECSAQTNSVCSAVPSHQNTKQHAANNALLLLVRPPKQQRKSFPSPRPSNLILSSPRNKTNRNHRAMLDWKIRCFPRRCSASFHQRAARTDAREGNRGWLHFCRQYCALSTRERVCVLSVCASAEFCCGAVFASSF